MLLIALIAATVRADESVPVMTLPDALAYATHHPSPVDVARARLEAALADEKVATSPWLPSVGALVEVMGATSNNSTATALPDGAVTLPRVGATAVKNDLDWTPHATTVLAIGVRQQLYDFGRSASALAAARAASAIERARVRGTELDLELAVVAAYYGVLGARGTSEVAEAAERRASVNHDYVAAAVRSGMRPAVDLTRAVADLERARVGLVRARAGVRISRSVLAAAIGADASEVDAAALTSVGLSPIPTAADVASSTLHNHPLLRELDAGVRAQEAATEAWAAAMRPYLYASGTFSARAGGADPSSGPAAYGDGWLPVTPNYHLGVALSWPLWDPISWRKKQASRARENVARATLATVRVGIVHQAEQARQRVAVAQESLSALERAEAAARANQEQAQTRLRAGLGTIVELSEAEALLVDAQLALVAGRYQLMTARAELQRFVAEGP